MSGHAAGAGGLPTGRCWRTAIDAGGAACAANASWAICSQTANAGHTGTMGPQLREALRDAVSSGERSHEARRADDKGEKDIREKAVKAR